MRTRGHADTTGGMRAYAVYFVAAGGWPCRRLDRSMWAVDEAYALELARAAARNNRVFVAEVGNAKQAVIERMIGVPGAHRAMVQS